MLRCRRVGTPYNYTSQETDQQLSLQGYSDQVARTVVGNSIFYNIIRYNGVVRHRYNTTIQPIRLIIYIIDRIIYTDVNFV